MADLDAYLTQYSVAGIDRIVEDDEDGIASDQFHQDWLAYLADCSKLIEAVSGAFPRQKDRFISSEYGLLQAADPLKSPAKNIIQLYNHLRAEAPEAPLFESFANDTTTPPIACLPANSSFAYRIAHPGDTFPLATAQRDALTHLCPLETARYWPSTVHRVLAKQRWCYPWLPRSGLARPWPAAILRLSRQSPATTKRSRTSSTLSARALRLATALSPAAGCLVSRASALFFRRHAKRPTTNSSTRPAPF